MTYDLTLTVASDDPKALGALRREVWALVQRLTKAGCEVDAHDVLERGRP